MASHGRIGPGREDPKARAGLSGVADAADGVAGKRVVGHRAEPGLRQLALRPVLATEAGRGVRRVIDEQDGAPWASDRDPHAGGALPGLDRLLPAASRRDDGLPVAAARGVGGVAGRFGRRGGRRLGVGGPVGLGRPLGLGRLRPVGLGRGLALGLGRRGLACRAGLDGGLGAGFGRNVARLLVVASDSKDAADRDCKHGEQRRRDSQRPPSDCGNLPAVDGAVCTLPGR